MVGDSANNASTRDSARSVGVFATFISPSESICADPSESTSVSLAVSVTTTFFAYLFRLPEPEPVLEVAPLARSSSLL